MRDEEIIEKVIYGHIVFQGKREPMNPIEKIKEAIWLAREDERRKIEAIIDGFNVGADKTRKFLIQELLSEIEKKGSDVIR